VGRTVRRRCAAALAGALLLAACGDDTGSSSASTEGSPEASSEVRFDDLVGRSFESTAVTGHELVSGTVIALSFIEGRLSAVGGCNTQNGTADIVDDRLEVGQLASTMMGCEEPLMAQDRWLGEFLEAGPTVALDGELLTLRSGDEVLELAETG
jgi:heat shock protein HslJ